MPRTLEALQHAMQRRPSAQTQLEIANLYRSRGDWQQALEAYRQAITLQPQAAELYYNLGTLLQQLEHYPQAIHRYREALQLKPALVQAWNNLGLVYQEQGLLDVALDSFNRAFEHAPPLAGDDPALAEVHRHRALLQLLRGDFEQGWSEYAWRHTDPDAVNCSCPLPLWDGTPLTGKTILVHAEQGVGDEIMFAGCYAFMLERAQQVIIQCEPRLETLFARSFTAATIVAHEATQGFGWIGRESGIDWQIPAGSLPGHMPRFPAGLPAGKGYLLPGSGALKQWQQRYAALGPGLKVGISWRGGRVAAKQRKRSTLLAQWQALFALEGVQFINLQYGDCSKELQQAGDQFGVEIHDWDDSDPLQDLDDLAAQITALDLVISVDNATVHLAGALGVPVWILQPFAPEWRWLMNEADSYWYQSVRQFRQREAGGWDDVFARVRQALEQRLQVSE